MDSTCVYELTQGLQMAEQLRNNLHSPETRNLLIQKILASYANALSVLQSADSAGQPPAPALPAPSLPESWIFTGSPGSEEFEFDQPFSGQQGLHAISKKRKGSLICEDQVSIYADNWRNYGQNDVVGAKFPRSYCKCSRKVEKCLATKEAHRTDEDSTVFEITYKGKHTYDHGGHSASSPPLPKNYHIMPTHHHHQLSPPSPGEMLPNLKASLSINPLDLGGDSDTVPSSFSFPSTSFGLMEHCYQLHLPNYYENVSPSFISSGTSESNIFSEWGSSQSLDFLGDVDTDFEFDPLF